MIDLKYHLEYVNLMPRPDEVVTRQKNLIGRPGKRNEIPRLPKRSGGQVRLPTSRDPQNDSLEGFFRSLKIIASLMMLALLSSDLKAQTPSLEGQLSLWTASSSATDWNAQVGFRYLPSVAYQQPLTDLFSLDADVALNVYGSSTMHTLKDIDASAKLKPYRASIRLSSSQVEVRAGLQKISFGSAMILRPLMWFDRIDPRDPLQITEGVYGILGRYYWIGNATVWTWLLYGNENKKGWEMFSSAKNNIEFGGRLQMPILTGEMAFSYHHRNADGDGVFLPPSTTMTENRYALDGKWDIGIGAWYEVSLTQSDVPIPSLKNQLFATLGADYTFPVGNGIAVMVEHLKAKAAKKLSGSGEENDFSACSVSYPVGLLDNFTGIVYHDWHNESWYRFIQWQRQYDAWSFYLIGFWNPEQFKIYQSEEGNSLMAGKGAQIMVVYNH